MKTCQIIKQSLKTIKVNEIKETSFVVLGDIIHSCIDFITSSDIGKIIITLDNTHIKGKYVIPNDLGLSTPLNLCEGGILDFYSTSCKSHRINYLKLLKKRSVACIFRFKEHMKSCSICFEEYSFDEELIKLPCGHVFHNDCICKYKKSSQTDCSCPLCRSPI